MLLACRSVVVASALTSRGYGLSFVKSFMTWCDGVSQFNIVQMLVARPRNSSLNWLRTVEVVMFVRLRNPSSSIVIAEIEADAVVVGFWSGISNQRERVLLIYLVTTPSSFAEKFNFRALFQPDGFDGYISGAHIDSLCL